MPDRDDSGIDVGSGPNGPDMEQPETSPPSDLRPAVPVAAPRRPHGSGDDGGLFTVPRAVTLISRIEGCDTLAIEGAVEAELRCRVLTVAPGGLFRGAAEVETAELGGTVEGKLTVRGLLSVRATGRVLAETVCYDELEVERGATIAAAIRPRQAGGPQPEED